MLLVTDIGNTNIVIGGMKDGQILFESRISTVRGQTSDEYAIEFLKILSLHGVETSDICDCIISSVVPQVLNAVSTGVKKLIHKQPYIVGPGLKTGLNIRTDNPSQVGSDRIVATVGALTKYQAPLIILDLGTATTIEVVQKDRTYVGGCIMPGVKTSLNALVSHTAQLPGISLRVPEQVIGRNTAECLQSGLLYGAAAMIDGMLSRIEQEIGTSATIVATGGIAPLVAPLCRRKIILEENLILDGLSDIYQRNTKQHK